EHLPMRIPLEVGGHPVQTLDLAGGRDDELGPRSARPAAAGAERDNPPIPCGYLYAPSAHAGDRRQSRCLQKRRRGAILAVKMESLHCVPEPELGRAAGFAHQAGPEGAVQEAGFLAASPPAGTDLAQEYRAAPL